eukprot:jgi/Bigna1/75128/fgenesh1_pg.32_\
MSENLNKIQWSVGKSTLVAATAAAVAASSAWFFFSKTSAASPTNETNKQATAKRFYIFGSPVGKSPSPLMHNTGFKICGLPHSYAAEDTVDPERVKEIVQRQDFGGASVTIPLKEKLFHLVTERSDAVKAIGALNTLIPTPDGRGLLADNTDWKGIVHPLKPLLYLHDDDEKKKENNKVKSSIGIVIGAGGTARAAVYALKQLGYDGENLVICNPRTPEKAVKLAKEFGCSSIEDIKSSALNRRLLQPVSVLICTLPAKAQYVAPDEILSQKPVVFEAIYLPPVTPLAIKAEAAGCKVVKGLDMLIAQGVEQFELWTKIPKSKVTVIERSV